MKQFVALILCITMLLASVGALAASDKNVNNLPIGTTEGYESGENWFGEGFAYDVTDEAACWELLQKPITVLDVGERETVYPLQTPGGKKVLNEWQGGYFYGSTAAVHVLGEDEDGWTLIEGMDMYDRKLTGYVKTKLLKTVTPHKKYGVIIDKLTQHLYVYIDGKLWSSCAVSTGLPNAQQPYNETATGEYLLASWVGGFDSEGMYCEMGIRFDGGDLIHQVPYTTLADGTKRFSKFEPLLGTKASHGCVRTARVANEDGLNIKWLWDNLKKGTKVLVWDDDGREQPYPSDDLELYYNPDGGQYYHASANCSTIKSKFLPLSPFKYSELDTGAYAELEPCAGCTPPKRKSVIDQMNYDRGAITLEEFERRRAEHANAVQTLEPTDTAPTETTGPETTVAADDDTDVEIKIIPAN